MSVIKYMDITDATSVFVMSVNSANNAPQKVCRAKQYNDEKKALFKITTDGNITQVTLEDGKGHEVNLKDAEIRDVVVTPVENTPYAFINIKLGVGALEYYYCYLVNVQTGNAYDLTYLENNLDEKYIEVKTAATDKYGNIYFGITRDYVYKVEVSNPDNMIVTAITPPTIVYLRSLYVDDDGNILYYGSLPESELSISDRIGAWRFRAQNGKMSPVDLFGNIFKGLDGKIHMIDSHSAQRFLFNEDGSWVRDTIIFHTDELEYDGGDVYIRLSDKIYVLVLDGCQCITIDTHNLSEFMQRHTINEGKWSTQHTLVNEKLYCLCDQAIWCTDMRAFQSSELFNDVDYIISSFIVKDDESIVFCGIRMSDGKDVIASVAPNGAITILDETLNSSTVTLIRLQ